MPRRRRRSVSPSDMMMADDDNDSLNDDFSSNSTDRCPPQQRNAANARERARMRVLSKAFCRLKTTLPWVPADTKLSKLDTLRLASGYIAHLRALLADQPPDDISQNGRPLNLTWPFTFQQGVAGTWSSSATSPGRLNSPRIQMDQQSMQSIHHNNYENNVDGQMCYNTNNNDNYFNRNTYYPQNDNNNYYNHVQRENHYLRHSYSESMLHTG